MGLRVSVLVEVHTHDGEALIARVERSDLTFNSRIAAMDLSDETPLAASALRTLSEEAIARASERLEEWAETVQAAMDTGDDD